MINDVLDAAEKKMIKAGEVMAHDLGSLRTGRASPGLVENIKVDYYGTPTPLNQVASISAPEVRLLIIQPWDKQAIPAIEKALQKSDLGLNPANDGTVLRLMIPQLTEERRKDLVKLVKKRVEEGRIAIRNVRREALEKLREMQKSKEISEDDQKRAEKDLQDLTDKYVEKASQMGKDKEQEVLET